MLVKVYIETNREYYTYCNGEKEDYFSEGDYHHVDVPLQKIAEIIAKRYDISADAMYEIICDFDIDLDDEVEYNDEIQDLAREIYFEEYDSE